MASGNIIRFGAQLDDQVSKKLTGIRGAFDSLSRSKGFAAVTQGIGIGAGISIWGALGSAVGQATSFIKGSIDAASDFNETVTKSQQIFGPAQDAMMAWASTASSAFGQSQKQALDTASTFAGLFQTVGMAADESANMAQRMVELGSDLASFFNTDVAQAVGALRSGLAGESEPLRRFNVFLTETTLAAKAAEMGLTKVGGKLTEQQKIMARYAIIMEQTAAAQGDFGRTSEGLANQQRTLDAKMADLSATIGRLLLPFVLEAVLTFNDFLDVAQDIATTLDQQLTPALTDTAKSMKAIDVAAAGVAEGGAVVAFLRLFQGMGVVAAAVPAAVVAAGTALFNALVGVGGAFGDFNTIMGEYKARLADSTAASRAAATKWRTNVAEMREASVGLAASYQAVPPAIDASLRAITAKMAEGARAAQAAGIAAIKGVADGIRSARREIDSALDDLEAGLAASLNKQAEIGRLGGLLTGETIADGLADGDEANNKSAQYLVALIEARLDELTDGAYTRGKRAALALAAGFAEKLPANLRSELRDVVEAAAEYEAIRDTFSKPAPHGDRLAGILDDTASSAKSAATSIRDVRAALGEAVAPLSQAKSLLAQFVAASGSYVDFSPKLMTTEQAAARVATVLGRVNTAIRNLRTSSSGSLSAVASAFDRLKAVAMDYFDAVHRANLRQIEDARMAAMAQYDAQIAQINAGVEAYRAELEAKRQARQEEQLKEALANAETPEEVKSAQEALTDFYEQQHLQRLEDQARAQIAALEAQRTADSKMYDAQVEAENQRYEQQRSAYEKLTTLLTESLDKMKGVWGSKQEEILKLLASYVGPFGAAGQALVNAFQGAISGATAGAGATVGAAPRVTSPGTLDQADIDALNKYIGNLQAIDDRTAAQQAKLDMYIDRLTDYQSRLAGTRATGGPVLPGRTYLVGESGPEYLTMGGSGGYVSPNNGQPVVIQLTVDGRELARVVDRNLYYTYRLSRA